MESNIEEIKKAFTKQAAKFNDYQNDRFKTSFTEDMVTRLDLSGVERALEIAAGTCALGRAIAPRVASVTELDITEAMLEAGRRANEKAGIHNAEYVLANAEELPFEDGFFDLTVTRLSFHHFRNPERIMREMTRVTRAGGRVAFIDMLPPDEQHREKFDYYETLRDASHVHTFTRAELESMATSAGLTIIRSAVDIFPMNVASWLDLTDTVSESQKIIIDALTQELNGGEPSGMDAHMEDGLVVFNRHWLQIIAEKR